MKEILMTSEQELQQEYPYEMEEHPFEERRRRRSAKEVIKAVLRTIGNVLLYGLIGVAGFVVLVTIMVLIEKFFGEKAGAIAMFVFIGAAAIGSLVWLVFTFRWLILWLKDLNENRKKKREISKYIAELEYMGGMMYYESGDDEKSIKCFRIAAEHGHQEAAVMYCLQYIRGVRENQDYGFGFYMNMALMGIAEGQNEVGNYYANGISVVQNSKKALKWYRKAANQGYAISQCNIGNAYLEGKGVAQNYKKAAKWFRLAAEQGCAQAQNNLGTMYYNGQGVEQNYEEAVRLFRLAAEQGDVNSQNNLERLI